MNLVQVLVFASFLISVMSQLYVCSCLQAKKFVETLPATVRTDISKEEAEKLKDAIAAAGGVCELV